MNNITSYLSQLIQKINLLIQSKGTNINAPKIRENQRYIFAAFANKTLRLCERKTRENQSNPHHQRSNTSLLAKTITTVATCLIITILTTATATAAQETVTEIRKGENIKSATILISDQYYRQPQTGFITLNQGIALKLYHTDIERVYRDYEWTLAVNYNILLRFNDGTSTTETGSLALNGSHLEDNTIIDLDLAQYPGAAWGEVTVTSVNFQDITNTAAITSISNDFHLELSAISERIYELITNTSPTITASTYNSTQNTLDLQWSYITGAESYDLEWVYIADGEEAPNTHRNLDYSYNFTNATRINLAENNYKLPLAYSKGSVIYRVRGVGYDPTDLNTISRTIWSYEPTTLTLAQASIDNSHYYYYMGLDGAKNWTYTAVYAEEGKRKEVATYFDGSGRNRQQVTVQNTDDFAVVGETYYDFVGRGSVNVLPTPIANEGVRFYGTASTPFNGSFGPENFATDDHLDEAISILPEPLPSTGKTANYYSLNNPLEFVNKDALPLESEYPYTFTQFTNDGTERPKVQTGIGSTLNWKAANSKNTRFYYEKARQPELDRLFGNEAGAARYYQKVISLDPNGQQSVQYLDAKGRVIATALAGDNPAQLDALSNKVETGLSARIFTGSKTPYNSEVRQMSSFTATDISQLTVDYTLLPTEFTSCYQLTSNPSQDLNLIRYNIFLKAESETGAIIDEVILSGNSAASTDLSFMAEFKQYKISRVISIDSTHKANFLMQESILMEASKYTATCGPKWWISADTICEPLDCDSACYRAYSYSFNDSLFYTDDNGNTYRLAGGSTYEWVEDPNLPRDTWLETSINAPWNLEIDSCKINCADFNDPSGAGDARQFFANDRCDIAWQTLVNDMSPGGKYLSNEPGQYYTNDDGTHSIQCDSMYCYTLYNQPPDGVYDSTIFTINQVDHVFYNVVVNNSKVCISDNLNYINGGITGIEFYNDGFPINNGGSDINQSSEAFYICLPLNPVSTSYNLTASNLSDFNTATANNFSSWDDLKANWDDSFGPQLLPYHPEYCAHQFFCNYSFSCGGNTYTMKDLNTYLGNMYGAGSYTAASSYTTGGSTYNFMNPLGFTNSATNGVLGDNKGYIQEAPLALDPLFACAPGLSSELSTFALDSLNKYLFQFIPVYDNLNIATGKYYSLWYLLDDPDGIAQANGGDNAGLSTSIISTFNAFHGDGNCHQGIIQSNNDKYTFFIAIYNFLREKVLTDWFENHYLCANGNLYTYWEGDQNYDGLIDSNNYELIYPKNPLFDIYSQGINSNLIDTIKKEVSGVFNNYAVSALDTCTALNFSNWVETLGQGLTTAQITDSLNNSFCGGFTTTQVDTFINVDIYDAYRYMALLPDSLKCKLSTNYILAEASDCSETLATIARQEANERWDIEKTAYLDSLSAAYDKVAFDALETNETVLLNYTLGEYHYTLYYYDQSGSLVKTIPPAGVQPLDATNITATQTYRDDNTQNFIRPDHNYVTLYTYNTQNQLIEQTTPDGGTTNFWYDNAARLVVSQNAKQSTEDAYSYSIYDGLSRIVESGETHHGTIMTDEIAADPAILKAWLSMGPRNELTFTLYDRALTDISSATAEADIEAHFGHKGQRYLRNRVASTMYIETMASGAPYIFNNDPINSGALLEYLKYSSATHYSYDPHGNVETLIQDFPELNGAPWYRRFFKIDYDYDLVSGNVNQVSYQKGYNDAFYHRYLYDADNRIRQVETSTDQIIWEKEARYYYYPHGPLSRSEIGDQHIQGMDYAYTIQGWLKAVNGTNLGGSNPGQFDLGGDGLDNNNLNELFARDAFGFDLHYFNGDYTPYGSTSFIGSYTGGSNAIAADTRNLYNGNISRMTTAMMDNTQADMSIAVNTYRYDQLNRITGFDSYSPLISSGTNTISGGTNGNQKAEYSYDPNGNITHLKRWKQANILMDDLSYKYDHSTTSEGLRNRLIHVNETVGVSADDNDIDPFSATYDPTNLTNANNYRYDAIGNLIYDEAEEIKDINWMVNGKVKSIDRTSGSTASELSFEYDALGNRIKKQVVDPAAPTQNNITWYVRDAQGNVMATYKQNNTDLKLKEQHLYGSDRLGLNQIEKTTADIADNNNTNLTLEAWTNYTIMPYGLTTSMTINISGDYTFTIKALEEEITIPIGTTTPLAGLYTSDVNNYIIPQGASITLTADAITNISIASPFELSVSKDGTLNSGSFTYFSQSNSTQRMLGNKRYELKNHLGSVHTVISDRKLQVEDPNNLGTVAYYSPNVTSFTDYYPFGMTIGHRSLSSSDHRYGFNGMEKDNEVKTNGNSYTTQFRQYDPRLGKWLSPDPVIKASLSPYNSMSNSPIIKIDPRGDDDFFTSDGKFLYSTGYGNEVRILNSPTDLAQAMHLYSKIEDHNQKKMTKFLRKFSSSNLIDHRFNSSEPIKRIFTFYNQKHLKNKEVIHPDNKVVGGYMAVMPSNKKEPDETGKGHPPRIFVAFFGITYFQVDPIFESKANILNTLVHEKYHFDNHTKKRKDGYYQYTNTALGTGDKANLEHLEAFEAQVQHETWIDVTEEYRSYAIKLIKAHIDNLVDEDVQQGQKEKFKNLIGDDF